MKIKRYQLIELPIVVPAAGLGSQAKVYFQQQPQVQTIMGDKTVNVDGIETLTEDTMSVSPFQNNIPIANAAQIANASLSLSMASDYWFENIPLASMCRISAPGTFSPFAWYWFELIKAERVNWTKSFVTLSAAYAGPNYNYLFGVAYHFDNDIMS